MLEKRIQELAEEFGADLSFNNSKIWSGGIIGTSVPMTKFNLKVPYKNHEIEIVNELGNYNLGHITLNLNQRYIPDFEITAIEHIFNLFLRRKDLLKIKCKDASFKARIEQLSTETGLQDIARNNSFEPKIKAFKDKNLQFLHTDYSLQFDDKVGGLRALILFYQRIIDLS